MDDQDLLRYSRHILLDDLGAEGQSRLRDSHAVILGLGGLGSSAATYLSTSGIGHLTLVDHDDVDLSNLQRQPLHATDDIGKPKVESARKTLAALNPGVDIDTLTTRADESLLAGLTENAEILLDCSDNFEARYAANDACVTTRTPLVSGSAIRWRGQVGVFPLDDDDSPCYACIYPPDTTAAEESCGETGVLAPLVGVIGSLQAVEAVKFLTGLSNGPRLYRYDALTGDWSRTTIRRDDDCRVCGPSGR